MLEKIQLCPPLQEESMSLIRNEENPSLEPMKKTEEQLLAKLHQEEPAPSTANSTANSTASTVNISASVVTSSASPVASSASTVASSASTVNTAASRPAERPPQSPGDVNARHGGAEQQRPRSDLDNKAIKQKLDELTDLLEGGAQSQRHPPGGETGGTIPIGGLAAGGFIPIGGSNAASSGQNVSDQNAGPAAGHTASQVSSASQNTGGPSSTNQTTGGGVGGWSQTDGGLHQAEYSQIPPQNGVNYQIGVRAR